VAHPEVALRRLAGEGEDPGEELVQGLAALLVLAAEFGVLGGEVSISGSSAFTGSTTVL